MRILAYFTVGLVLAGLPAGAEEGTLDNVFFPFNNSVMQLENAPATLEGKVELLKELGYDGLEGYGPDTFAPLKSALKAQGLSMPCNYNRIDLEPGKPAYDPGLKEMIRQMDPGEALWLHLHSQTFKDDHAAGDAYATGVLRELSGFAAPFGVELAVYLHINTYCETVAHGVRLAELVARENFGTTLNLCHLLAAEGSENIGEKIALSMPHLTAVSICGADGGDTKGMSWMRLIQPLGDGDFDVYAFVRTLKDLGYAGPIGLQCYNIKGDCRTVLAKSMATWRAYQARYAAEGRKQAARPAP